MRIKPVILLCLGVLTACSTPQERAEREAQQEIAACTDAGYKPGTPAFDDCREQVQAREAQKAADRTNAMTGTPGSRYSPSMPQGNNISY